MTARPSSNLRCPICGEGVLAAIAFGGRRPEARVPKQGPESRELLTFSCGHEVEGGKLAEAARDDQNVERRTADDSVTPIMRGGAP
jgi:hypothetical protein